VTLLTEMLVHLGQGCPVTVFPDHAELTTQQGAEFLNVSRPWIVKLIDRGEIRHHMVGTHRRVFFSDLLEYRERMKVNQRKGLDQLVAEAQAAGEYS
jgi:excisionase family DNA binding protein